ncbi:CHAT domain-containing protein [Glaciecola sp. 1036]|uniref:CHAT domain-containing protein n=1 Tax=Alteromonadaceae TaxID=72275 RepID=UPI003D03F9AE
MSKTTQLELVNNENALVVFTLKQEIADARVVLTSCHSDSSTTQTIINSPDTYRLPEIFAVYPKSQNCKISISASDTSDSFANIELSWFEVKQPSIDLITALAHLVEAEQKWSNYFEVNEAQQSNVLANVIQSLTSAKNLLGDALPYWSHLIQYKQSEVYHYLGQYDEQARILQTLLDQPNLAIEMKAQAHVDLAIYTIYEIKDFDEASKQIELTFQLLENAEQSVLYADALETSASIEIERANFSSGIDNFVASYQIFMAKGAKKDALNTALSLGYFYYRTGELVRASQEYNAAKLLAESISESYSVTNANIKLATVYRNLGDYDKAAKFLDIALSQSASFDHSYLDAWAKLEKAKLLKATLQYHYAIDWFDKAKSAFKKLNAMADVYQINIVLADLYVDMQQVENAEKLYFEYLNYAQEELTQLQVAQVSMQIAELKLKQGFIQEAIDYQNIAHTYFQGVSDAFSLADTQFGLAASYAALADIEKATFYFDAALRFYESIEATPSALSAILEYAKYISLISKEKALSAIDVALEQSLNGDFQVAREDLSIGFTASLQDLLSLKIKLDDALTAEQSLVLVENIKAKALKRFFYNKADFTSNSEQEKSLAAINSQISQQLVALQNASASAHPSLLQELRRLSEERYKVEQSIYFDRTDSSDQADFDLAALSKLRQNLQDHQLVLFVDSSDIASKLWFISKNNVKQFNIKDSKDLNQQVVGLLENIKKHKSYRDNKQIIQKISNSLFPDPSVLKQKQELIVIADGALANLPFSVLENPTDKSSLLNSLTVSFHQSLALLMAQMTTPDLRDNQTKSLIVASPEMQALENGSSLQAGYKASNLPFSKAEAEYIGKTLGTDAVTLIGKQANKQNIKQQMLPQFNILHFATHAVANSDFPELGGLVLSNSHDSDNLLLAPEIKKLHLNAHLVVLSGCDSAIGKTIAGEGMLGLSRAFMQAGARNVIGSLWKVQDDVTAKLMQLFYQYHIEQNMSAQLALVHAQRDVRNYKRKDGRRPWRAPYYWAGFILHGTGS